jgi:competence protein ComEC
VVGTRALVEWIAAGLVAGQLLAGTGARCGPIGVAVAGVVLVASALVARRSPGYRDAMLAVATSVVATLCGDALAVRATAVPRDPAYVARLGLPLRARVTGRVVEPPLVANGRTTLVLATSAVEASAGHGRRAWGHVRVRVRGTTTLERGDVIAFDTTLRRPRNFENPGRFDMVSALARRGIHVVASIWNPDAIERVAPPREPREAAPPIDAWRAAVRRLIATVGPPDVSGVLVALVLGDERGIADADRAAFSRAGVVHVLSVSGLHVGIVTASTAYGIAWLFGWSEWLLLHVDRRKVAAAGGLAAAIVYGALTGFAVATLRSIATAGAVGAAVLLDRRVEPWRALALAACALTLIQPGAPAEISYQLSFASVVALLAAARGAMPADPARWRRWTLHAARASAAAWIGTAPLTAFHFHQVSLVSVAANPVVVPLFEGLSVLPALAGAVLAPIDPALARVPLELATIPLRAALTLVRMAGGWRWAAIDVPFPDRIELALLYGVIAGTWWRRATSARLVATACLLALAMDAGWWAVERGARRDLRVTFLDVGQGDAAVVELPGGRVLVVDAGGFPGSDFDTGAAIVEPFLRARKIQSVDALVMSHAHPDHAGGLAHLVRSVAPAELWWSGEGGTGAAWDATVRALEDVGVPVRLLRAGTTIPDFPEVDVAHPPVGWSDPSLNEGSLVLRIRGAGTAVLLTGDAEAAAEAAMMEAGAAIAAPILKVPHHGSRTSSAAPFVAAVAPSIAVVSVGAENRFGHPAPEVVARYTRAGAAVYRTDRCGAITVVAGAGAMQVDARRGRACVRPPITTPPRR